MAQKYHHGELRQALLDIAVQQLAEHGEESLSVRALADRAGVSHAAPYHHFGKRDDLLGSIAEEGFRRALLFIQRQTGGVDEPLALIRALGLAYIDFAAANPALFRLMFGHGLRYSDRHRGLAAARDGFWQSLIQPVSCLVEQGRARTDVGPEELAFSLWAHVHGFASILANRDRWSLDNVDFDAAHEGWVTRSVDGLLQGLIKG